MNKKYYRVAMFVLIGLLVMVIGGLAGWYVVLRQKGQVISFSDAARGFGFGAPSAGQNGSNYDNLGGGAGGGGFAIGGGNGSVDNGGTFSGGTGTSGGAGANGAGTGDFGSGDASSSTQFASSTSPNAPAYVFKTPRLWHVTKTPVAGFEFATGTPALYYAERATGYLFRADAVSGDVLRRTNTLFPKTYEAYVARDGGAIYRSINETSGALQTFTGVVGSSSSSNLGTFVGINLPNNLMTLDANPDSKTIFYLSADGGSFSAFTQPWVEGKSGKEKFIFSSNIASWKFFALADGRLMAAEKPQDGAAGYAYEIGPDGTLKPLVRAAPGLTFLPQSGTKALIFGTSAGGAISLYSQTSTTTLLLPVKTIADKCVWSPYFAATKKNPATDLVIYCAVPNDIASKSFIENWYLGALHTSDSWWRINLTSGKSDQILNADTGGVVIDVVDPAIDPSGSILAFKNGIDGTLWTLRVVK